MKLYWATKPDGDGQIFSAPSHGAAVAYSAAQGWTLEGEVDEVVDVSKPGWRVALERALSTVH